MQAYIKHGWSSNVIDPDGRTKDSVAVRAQSSSQLITSSENCNWQPLKDAFTGSTTNQTLPFRCDLLVLNQPCAFLDILVPSVDKIQHDHCYSRPPTTEDSTCTNMVDDTQSTVSGSDLAFYSLDEEFSQLCANRKAELNVSFAERVRIEVNTQNQSLQQDWHIQRSRRITGSKCGKILCQNKKSVALLRQCVYPKPLDPPPAPIAWGRHYEALAIQQYVAYMKKLGCLNISVKKCGFIIHPKKGWIGASPDGKVSDPDSEQPHGIIEVKCP